MANTQPNPDLEPTEISDNGAQTGTDLASGERHETTNIKIIIINIL